MSKNSQPKFKLSLLYKLLTLAKPYRGTVIATTLMAILIAPVAIARPYLINVMVDDYILKYDLPGTGKMTLIIVGVLILEFLLRYYFTYRTSWLGQSVIRDLRVRVFNHITSLKMKYFDVTPIGTSTTRTINDIETINSVFSQGVIQIVSDVLTLLAVMGVMFYTSWKLTGVIIIVFPLLLWGSYIFKEKTKQAFEVVRTEVARMNAFLQEHITGMRIVQIFNAEKQEATKFKAINGRYTKANLDSVLYYSVFFPVVDIISAISLGLMVWYGARGVLSDTVTMGSLIAFPIYINMLYRPVRQLADKFNTIQMGMIAAERVFKLLENDSQIPNPGTVHPPQLKGHIQFQSVNFSYTPDVPVLKDVNFEIQPGETLAIIGSTGSGKSTIINILSRFYDIDSGDIIIDDVPIKSYELAALRQKIGIVLQDVFLFNGTIMDNITLNNPSISEADVVEAAKMIGADEFIQKLPNAYDYPVMERGATLSMGQRQLISFIRALVYDPDVLVLDEATSNIDPETESVIQYAIERLIEKRTSIIIAHRLTTIRHSDNILVMNHGEVVEFGKHEELVQNDNGVYRELYELQFLANEGAV